MVIPTLPLSNDCEQLQKLPRGINCEQEHVKSHKDTGFISQLLLLLRVTANLGVPKAEIYAGPLDLSIDYCIFFPQLPHSQELSKQREAGHFTWAEVTSLHLNRSHLMLSLLQLNGWQTRINLDDPGICCNRCLSLLPSPSY